MTYAELEKRLLRSLGDYVELHLAVGMGLNEVEHCLNLEFAYANGDYPSKLTRAERDARDGDEMDTSKFRVRSNETLPHSYPCVAVCEPRITANEVLRVTLVYLGDFETRAANFEAS